MKVKKLILLFMLVLLFGCVDDSKVTVDNAYFQKNYGVEDTELDLKVLSLDDAFRISETIKEKDFIILIIRDGCQYSKEFLQMFVSLYNQSDYKFQDIYILELSRFSDDDQRSKFIETFNTTTVPTTMFYKDGNLYLSEIGYLNQENLSADLNEFDQ